MAGKRLGALVGLVAFIWLLFGPGVALDPIQRKVAAVTALTAILWVTVAIPVGAASLVPAIAFPLLNVMPAKEAAPLYMGQLVQLFLGAFIIALGLERWGVHKRMALGIVDFVGSSQRRLVLGFMVASAFLSLWIANTATTLLMLPIALAVAKRIEAEDKNSSNFAVALLLGVAYASSVGGMGTPVGTAPNQEFLGQFEMRFPDGPKISFGDWFLAWTPLVICFIPLAWLLMTRVLLPLSGKSQLGGAAIREERLAQGPMATSQKRMAFVFGLTALLWVTRADLNFGAWTLPGWSRLFLGAAAADPAWYNLHKNDISDATVALFMALMCFLIPAGTAKREQLMNWETARRLPWDVLLLLGGGFCIAKGFQVSGLDAAIGSALAPLIEGSSDWVIIGVVALALSLLTEVTSNTATTAVLLPVLAAMATAAGLNPLLLMMPATIAASAAFMMPAATPPNAVVFASGKIRVSQMVRTGFFLNILTVGLLVLCFQLWVRPLWNIGHDAPDWALSESTSGD